MLKINTEVNNNYPAKQSLIRNDGNTFVSVPELPAAQGP
jgi:hypothetical protein